MNFVYTQNKRQYESQLYRLVFSSVYAKFTVLCLFLILLLQPIAPAFANETITESAPTEGADSLDVAPASDEDVVVEEVVTEVAPTESVEPEDVDEVAEEVASTEETTSLNEEISTSTNENVIDQEPNDIATEIASSTKEVFSSEVDKNLSSTSDATSTTETSDAVASPNSDIDSEIGTTTIGTTTSSEVHTETEVANDAPASTTESVEESAIDTDVSEVESTPTTNTNMDPAPQPTAETSETPETEEQSIVQEEVQSLHHSNANKYQFSATDCVAVGDGSYYCTDKDVTNTSLVQEGVYAESDANGDREIYINVQGEITKLTDNGFEDFAPYYDKISQSVVWHRLISGRYEVVAYDLKEQTETVLTNNDVNDMEPTRSGDYTVWQRWIDSNWEIVLFDGEKEKVLTNNTVHDLAPHIKGDYVVWHSNDIAGKRTVLVYEIKTGFISEIGDADGGLVENPRFVLVYDTTYENGDIITKGYDFESGEVAPLSALPGELPVEIPPSDSTGETRALIQNKSTSTKEEIVDIDPIVPTPDSVDTATSSISETDTIVIPDAPEIETSSTTLDMTATTSEPFALTEFDVIVEPYIQASSTQEVNSETDTSSVE